MNSDLSDGLRQWIIAEIDTSFPELRQESEGNNRRLKMKAVTVCACYMNEFGPEHGKGRCIDKRRSLTGKWFEDRRKGVIEEGAINRA